MVFIDGSWLYKSRTALFQRSDKDGAFEIDYAKIPRLLCDNVARVSGSPVDCVRTLYFGTIPSMRSGYNTSKQYSFYDFLEKSCGYETEIHEVDVSNNAAIDDTWVKMSLGASMLFYAGHPAAFDIAIILADDLDYTPVLRRVRLFGKRVQVVGLHLPDGSVPSRGQSLFHKSRINDFPPVFLDDYLADLRLVRSSKVRVCKQCGAEEQTTWAGVDFFCSSCRGRYRSV